MAETTARWRIVAIGTVQLVNYRERVQRVAAAHKITGTVENDKKDEERVLIDAQGSPSNLRDFMRSITGPEGRSDAREVIKSKEIEPDTSFKTFVIKKGKARQETLERVEFTRHVLATLTEEVEALRGEVQSGHGKLGTSVEHLNESLSALSGTDASAVTSLASLSESIVKGFAELQEKVDSSAKEAREAQDDYKSRLEQLEARYDALTKTLEHVEETLEIESHAREERARSTEKQRAAILRLAGELEQEEPDEPSPRSRRK